MPGGRMPASISLAVHIEHVVNTNHGGGTRSVSTTTTVIEFDQYVLEKSGELERRIKERIKELEKNNHI